MRSASASSLVQTKPPTTSEWPLRYLVVEWVTMSKPSSSGRWKYGVMKVLSQTRDQLVLLRDLRGAREGR